MKKTFEKIDFNHLKALYVLLEERSVTRAADRLLVTQSAMSKTLRRLREEFDDPLLVRIGSRLSPTPRAEKLLEPLREVVGKVEGCFELQPFDPSQAAGSVRIGAPEQFAFATIPDLLVRLQKKAPNLRLDSQHLTDNHRDMLASGLLDFIVTREEAYSDEFSSKKIYSALPVCLCRKGHKLAKKKLLTLEDIYAYPLISLPAHFSAADINFVRREIARTPLKSTIILETTHMIVAIDALTRTDSLMFASDFLSRLPILQEAIHALSLSNIPVFAGFRMNLFLVQHRRTLNSPVHRWLAEEIIRGFAQ